MIFGTAIAVAGATAYHGISRFRWLDGSEGTAGTRTLAQMDEFLEGGGVARVAGDDGPAEIGHYTEGGCKYLRNPRRRSWTNKPSALRCT